MPLQEISRESVLFITLDSCRYDTFIGAHLQNLKTPGPVHKAIAPSYFTYASHSAMFVGFTPGVPLARQSYLNPKFGRIFRLKGGGFSPQWRDGFQLSGANIIAGFSKLGYLTIGTGAVRWFDPDTPTGSILSAPFDHFFYPGNIFFLRRQLSWVEERIATVQGQPVFVFINVGETHVPYYYNGAPWSLSDNPCRPFQTVDRSQDCRIRQTACLEYADRELGSILQLFKDATIVICGDHGDCWGEDGLWEHGVSHEMTLTVPLIVRMMGKDVGRCDDTREWTYSAAHSDQPH